MKKIVKIGMALLLVMLFLIPSTVAQTQKVTGDVELSIKGGLFLWLSVTNNKDTTITATYFIQGLLSGKQLMDGETTVPPRSKIREGYGLFGLRFFRVTLSACGQSISRTGFSVIYL